MVDLSPEIGGLGEDIKRSHARILLEVHRVDAHSDALGFDLRATLRAGHLLPYLQSAAKDGQRETYAHHPAEGWVGELDGEL